MEKEAGDEARATSGLYLSLEAPVLEGVHGREGTGAVRPFPGGRSADDELAAGLIMH